MSLQGPRVRDYTDAGRRLTVDAAHGPAFELLFSLYVFSAGCEGEEVPYEAGAEWDATVRARASAELLTELERFGGCGEVWLGLVGEAFDTRAPRTVPAFLDRLAATDPIALRRHVLSIAWHGADGVSPERVERAAAGDASVFDEVRGRCDEAGGAGLRYLMALEPDESLERLIDVLRRYDDEVFDGGATTTEVLARDAEEKRTLAAAMPPEQLVETATGGITFKLQPEVSGVVVVPSVVIRPWALIIEHGSLRIFAYSVSEEVLSAGPDAPAPWMVGFYKALADERRLRILARLAEGPTGLAELTEHLGLAKSTVHHHLRVLRTAGLVRVTVGEEKEYSLRRDAVPEAGRMLEAYLSGPVGVDNVMANDREETSS
jgi:DNA-binding transcriptional ArsR family regulator